MNSIITIDKLIICYQIINSRIRLNKSYFSSLFPCEDSVWDLGNGLRCYENISEDEKEIPSGFQVAVELYGEKIGTLFLDVISRNRFHFKFEKHLFYTYSYSISEIKECIDSIFPTFLYEYSGISRLEIACDTNQSRGVDLFVIADLCKANTYFRSIQSIEDNPNDLKTIQKFGGRKFLKAKYGVTIPKLRIYHHTKFPFTTCIGDYKSDIFLKCYEKSKKWEKYQQEYFDRHLPNSKRIFRLEVSLNSKAVWKHNIQFDQLGDNQYLKSVYFATAKQRLTFNRFTISRKTRKQVKDKRQICILDNLKFIEKAANQVIISNNQIITSESRKSTANHEDTVNNFKGQVAKLIGTYLRGENQTATFNKISKIIQEVSLDYQFTFPVLQPNIQSALELVDKRLEKGIFLNGVKMANRLRSLIQDIPIQIKAKESIDPVEEVITVKSKRDKHSHRRMGVSLEIRTRKVG